ncbi:MAG: hypothetical protein BIP78_1446 [Candidatus Bipolaricaulis sibiricus]|uniref:4Fe-4S ferredoxin-type domain-containing protein n=1 Tax=Bipolaricaulis sibiricus TaxID=2501609 RepID=A0A410FW57_BIPS1|nr:MAG: hypothetical protein BIP78_1446 [Candidatus Bipolaricaulis sibiricus]
MHPNRTVVSIRRAQSYAAAELGPAVAAALADLGGLSPIVPRGAKVFVKVNHLSPPSPPERGIVTHPALTAAVLTLLTEITPRITVGDDLHASTPDGFEVSGYRAMCERLGVELVNLRELGFTRIACNGVVLKEVYLARAAVEADVVINLPKLKTHSLTLFTGAVKNMYGAIPGGLRVAFHGQFKNPQEFNQVLVDIFAAASPHLTIMDGVAAMEGAGPANGSVRTVGAIVASRDGVAVDAVACQIIGLDPLAVGTTRYAHHRHVGVADAIEIVGDPIATVAVPDFRLPPLPAGAIVGRAPRFLTRFITSQISARPRVVPRACIGCGACARICPTGAATVTDGTAAINRRTCIRCMCCHEVCRFSAIALGGSALSGLIRPLLRAGRRARPRP